jgi:hypothetical protein
MLANGLQSQSGHVARYFLDMHIAALNIHPIKSCRAVAVDQVEVDRYGLVGDRRLMLVRSDGRFVSQREFPALATLTPTLRDGTLFVTGGSGAAIELKIDLAGPLRAVSVWGGNVIQANDQGDAVSGWFTEQLGAAVRLVAFGLQARNPIDADYSSRLGAETAFTDGYPIMAVNQASLDDLNRRLDVPVPMSRFRPSIVVADAVAWNEDDWHEVRFGDIECDVVKPCARCVITTTDQRTGAVDTQQEPLRTLATFRTHPGLGAIFGQNIVPRGTGMLRVGAAVQAR